MKTNLITMKRDVLIPDPPLARLLFNTTTFAWLWAIVRIYLGYQWVTAGWHKLSGGGWIDGGAGAAFRPDRGRRVCRARGHYVVAWAPVDDVRLRIARERTDPCWIDRADLSRADRTGMDGVGARDLKGHDTDRDVRALFSCADTCGADSSSGGRELTGSRSSRIRILATAAGGFPSLEHGKAVLATLRVG